MKKGFTLIELLVTISIISVLMGLLLVSFGGAKSAARDGRRKADVEAIRSALELYRSDNGKYPGALATLSPTYMAAQLSDPQLAQQYTYSPTPGGCGGATNCTGYYLCARLELGVGTATNCANCGSSITCNYQTINP